MEIDQSEYFVSDELAKKFNNACRICLTCECSEDDPLISACLCSGTMKFIHLKCLQEW